VCLNRYAREHLDLHEGIYGVIAASKVKITAKSYGDQVSQKASNLQSLPSST